MATINDVAKLAGVSIGTVSNYLNNRYVGTQKSIAIQQAIEELHYAPNRTARELKSCDSSRIMLILPNIIEGVYSELAETVLTEMAERGYHVQIACTGDLPHKEQAILKECFSSFYAAVFLCSCNPAETELFARLQAKKPLIFLLRRPDHMDDCCYIGFDNFGVIHRITKALLEAGARDIALWTGPEGFSCERACIKAYHLAFSDMGLAADQQNIVSLPVVREIIFRQATLMFTASDYPRFVLTSSKLAADAIIEAAYYQNITTKQHLCVITLGDGKWSNLNRLYYSLSTLRSSKGLAQEACSYMIECLNAKGSYEHRSLQISDSFSTVRLKGICSNMDEIRRPTPISIAAPAKKRLKVVCNNCDTGIVSIQYLTPWISKSIGVDIDLELLPPYDLFEYARKQKNSCECLFDVIHLDSPWMQQTVSEGLICDMSDYFSLRPDVLDSLVPNLVSNTAMVNGRIYGVPTLLCSQILCYRKDYFEDPVLQNRFLEEYGHPLLPPKTWYEYMLIARFFTRAYNPGSPCEYGTVMSDSDNEMMLTELYPRIWAYGGRVYDDFGNVTLYSEETLQAIRNYMNCLQYSDHSNLLLPQCTTRFAEGNSAMLVTYDVHATNLLNYANSKVLDNVAFAPIPGSISTMGGWNFCINARSEKLEQCYNFLDWVLSAEFSLPYTLLGGCSPRRDVVQNPDIVSMFPWLKNFSERFQQSRKRYVPEQNGYSTPRETDVERILAETLIRIIAEPDRIKEYLRSAEQRLKALRIPV